MILKKISTETYRIFSHLEGNQHIASEFAIYHILKSVKRHKLKKILEVGLGIGSISYAVLQYFENKNSAIEYSGTEENEFCKNALISNLDCHYKKIILYNDLKQINNVEKFDFIIIDGGNTELEKLSKICSKNAVLFVEGDRNNQFEVLKSLFPQMIYHRVVSISNNPNYGPFSHDNWCGGGSLLYVNPTIFQYFVNYVGRIKASTGYNYRVRNSI